MMWARSMCPAFRRMREPEDARRQGRQPGSFALATVLGLSLVTAMAGYGPTKSQTQPDEPSVSAQATRVRCAWADVVITRSLPVPRAEPALGSLAWRVVGI
jgi:hypothetical protein